MEKEEKYAIYLRKSRADLDLEALGQGETLTRHQDILFDLAEKRDILPSQITVYREVVSGETIAARPEMQRLLDDVYKRKYKAVFCMEVERLARGNTKDQGEVSDAFQYSGTHIITPAKEYDPANEFDQEYFEFGLFMSRREYKTIKRRMEAGRLQSVREGNYVGSNRPYGYQIQRINKKERILVPDPDEAPIVKLIFDWFTEDHMTCGQIAIRLTKMHIPTLTGNQTWNRGTVADILRNDHYYGAVRWNRRKRTKEYDDGKLIKGTRRLSRDDLEIHQGKHEAIISKEQFDKAQSLFTGIAPVKANVTITDPLAGLLICSDCGKHLHYQGYYQRTNAQARYTHTTSDCKKKSCYASDVLEGVVEGLKVAIEDFEIKMSDEGLKADAERNKAVLDSLSAELESVKKRKNRLFDVWESDDTIYTKEEFLQRKSMYDTMISDIEAQIEQAKKTAPKAIDYTETIFTLHQAIDMILNPDVDTKAKNTFLKSIIAKIEYDVMDYGRNKGGKPILTIHLK